MLAASWGLINCFKPISQIQCANIILQINSSSSIFSVKLWHTDQHQMLLSRLRDVWAQPCCSSSARSPTCSTAAGQLNHMGSWLDVQWCKQSAAGAARMAAKPTMLTAAGVQESGPGNRLNGPSQFRNRMVAAQGYTVVSIPHWEWEVCQTAQQRATCWENPRYAQYTRYCSSPDAAYRARGCRSYTDHQLLRRHD